MSHSLHGLSKSNLSILLLLFLLPCLSLTLQNSSNSSNTSTAIINNESYQPNSTNSNETQCSTEKSPVHSLSRKFDEGILNPLPLDSYLSILRQNNFFGTWKSADYSSQLFQGSFTNSFGLIIVEALDTDISETGSFLSQQPSNHTSSISTLKTLFSQVSLSRNYITNLNTWDLLIKIYDGHYVDQISANMFYQVSMETLFSFNPDNATLYVNNGHISAYLKDDSGDNIRSIQCPANFSIYFINIGTSRPFKEYEENRHNVGVQYRLESPECNINIVSDILTINGFENTSEIRIYVILVTFIALLQILGTRKVKQQLKSRKAVFKMSLGSMWMVATVDYYLLILNLVLIFAYSAAFMLPFSMYMFLTFYIQRDIIIRMLQVHSKRRDLDMSDESCRACGFHFGLSTLLFVFELVFILMSKLWVIHLTAFVLVPQIFYNARRDRPYEFNFYHVFLMGAIRTLFIAYIKLYPYNIFRLSPDLGYLSTYTSIVALQIGILLIQTKYPRLGLNCFSKRRRSRILDEDDVCPICMCDLKTENTASESLLADSLLLKDLEKTVETPCSHVFHSQCLKKWLSNKVECPVCRTEIEETLEEVISSEDEAAEVSLQL